MKQIARTLWDALMGAFIAAGLLRVVVALGAAAEPDLMTGRTEQAGFIPQLFPAGFFVTLDELMLMNVMAATVLVVGLAWAIAHTLSTAGTRASD